MKIGIDISQTTYEKTGVASYLLHLLEPLIANGKEHSFILFFSSLRQKPPRQIIELLQRYKNVTLRSYRLPPSALHVLWNRLHIFAIEGFIGNVDIFLSSDWTQPPVRKTKTATILYDLIVYTYPEETDVKIVQTQKRRLHWVKKEVDIIFCISEATKQDAIQILGLDEKKLQVIYPGI